MPRFYLKLILPIALVFLTVSLAARALGTTQPPNPVLRGFTEGCENKPQPCWYGIVPGVTTFTESIDLLERQGFSIDTDPKAVFIKYKAPQDSMIQFVQFNYYSEQTGIVYLMVLILNSDARLGDFIAQLGKPNWISIYSLLDPIHLNYSYRGGAMTLNIGGGFEMTPFRQNLQVVAISSMEITKDNASHDWHGFIPARNYCSLENIPDTYCS